MIKIDSTFKERLVEAMRVRNMSQAELSKTTGLSKPRISQYVNGTYEAKQQALYQLSKALRVNVSWLMGFNVPMEIENDELIKEINICDMISNIYGQESAELVHSFLSLNNSDREKFIDTANMYILLDQNDQAELRGEMKHMLKADKYKKSTPPSNEGVPERSN